MLYVSVSLLKYLVSDQFLWFLWRSWSKDDFLFMDHVPLKGNYLVFHHFELIIISYLYCWVHIQYSILSGMGFIGSWIFEKIWVGTVDYFLLLLLLTSVFVGVLMLILSIMMLECIAKFCLKMVQYLNGTMSCLYLLSLKFQQILQLWGWM